MTDTNRRAFLSTAAGTLAGFPAVAYAFDFPSEVSANTTGVAPMKKGNGPVVAISSANGKEATRIAYEKAVAGVDTLDAAIAGVTVVENDPNDTSVGYGGLPNEDGIVELDAAVMHGPTHKAGAVGALRNIKNPASVAKLVMQRTDHVLLVGEGALRFARAHGFKEENLLTEKARKIWLHWKETHSKKDDWLEPTDAEIDPDVAAFFNLKTTGKKLTPEENALALQEKKKKSSRKTVRKPAKFTRPTGTIHCGVINGAGDISCTTTTSGLAFKIPGRVGDSPIIGAGLYCDNEVGSCGSTGRGEANLQNLSSMLGVELMRNGMSPKDAGMEVLKRIAKHTEKRLLNDKGQPDFGIKFYLLNKRGEFAGVSMWGPATFAVTDKKGARLEKCTALYQKK